MEIAVVIPTYNESDNITILIKKILDLSVKKLAVIVVDDNSPDGTGRLADKLLASHPGKIHVIHRPGKLGLGSAYIAGWKKAVSLGAQIVFSMDADLSHDPAAIPGMVRTLEKSDLVIGSRHVPGGAIVGFTWWRKTLTIGAQLFSRWFLGLPVHDSTSGFRGYRRMVVKHLQTTKIRSSGYSFLIEALYRAHRNGFKISELPIVFGLRNSGKSKISPAEIIKALKTVVRLRLLP